MPPALRLSRTMPCAVGALCLLASLASSEARQAPPQPSHATAQTFNRALGVECTHCHVQDRWPESTKPAFTTARNMMRMVEALNTRLGDLGPITCVTCHGGATRPARQPRPALDEQLARWPAALAGADESLKITMAVYNVALGVGCDYCHSADWKAKDKPAMKLVPPPAQLV